MTPNGMYCRACVCVLQHDSSRCPQVYNIFDTLNFAKKFKQCSSIHIEPYDQYPHSVCGRCYEKVLDFYEFQLMCRDSIRIFNEMYDCDNDLEEALCVRNILRSNATCCKETQHQNNEKHNDKGIIQADFQEDHVIDGRVQQNYENGDDELGYEDFIENTFCEQQDRTRVFDLTEKANLISPYAANNLLRNKCNGIDQYTLEVSENNFKKIEPNDPTIKNGTDQAKKDHIEAIMENVFIQQQESEIVIVNAVMVPNEIDVYTTSENYDNLDENKIEDPVRDEKEYTKTNERNNLSINKDSAITKKRQSKIQRKKTHKDRDGTCDLSKSEKIATGTPPYKAQIEMKSKPTRMHSFRCNICSKYFRFHHSLEAHKRQHEGLRGYPCSHENCDSMFDRFIDLQDHLNDHDGIPRTVFKCEKDNCERVFFRKTGLSMHMKLAHKCLPARRPHECVTCRKIFNDSQKLREHSFIHKDKSTWLYTCDVEGCMRKCRTWIHMRIHKDRHAGIKKFTCPHCGIAKTTSQELRSHINFHTSERTWSCEHCSKVCKSLANLQRHTKNKHSGSKRELKCSFCKATFATIEVKKSHEKIHTSDKPHVCEECGMRFIYAYKLRAHQKIHREKTNVKAAEK